MRVAAKYIRLARMPDGAVRHHLIARLDAGPGEERADLVRRLEAARFGGREEILPEHEASRRAAGPASHSRVVRTSSTRTPGFSSRSRTHGGVDD